MRRKAVRRRWRSWSFCGRSSVRLTRGEKYEQAEQNLATPDRPDLSQRARSRSCDCVLQREAPDKASVQCVAKNGVLRLHWYQVDAGDTGATGPGSRELDSVF